MDELNITAYANLTPSGVGMEPAVQSETMSIGAEIATGKALPQRVQYLRVVSTVDCRLGLNNRTPVMILPAGIPEYFSLQPNVSNKISVVQL